jgi:hypothetical protein
MIDRGLFGEDVEAGPADLARFDRVGKCRFVNQIAACRVDNPDALLRLLQACCVDQLFRLRRRWHVQRQIVGAREKVVHRHELDTDTARNLF